VKNKTMGQSPNRSQNRQMARHPNGRVTSRPSSPRRQRSYSRTPGIRSAEAYPVILTAITAEAAAAAT
jgi:hypothetical protein